MKGTAASSVESFDANHPRDWSQLPDPMTDFGREERGPSANLSSETEDGSYNQQISTIDETIGNYEGFRSCC